MKYKMTDFAAKHGMTLAKGRVYGVFEGYRVQVDYSPFGNPRCLISVAAHIAGKQKAAVEKYLDSHRRDIGISNFGVIGIGLMVSPKMTGEVFARAESVLEKICAQLKKIGVAGADVCPYCGQPLGGAGILTTESDIAFRAHEECFERVYAGAKRKAAEEEAKPDKKPLGMLGGFLGALFGAVVFVLTYAWWGIGALGTPVGILLGFYLYRKFGAKKKLFSVAWAGAAGLVLSLAALVFGLYMDAREGGGGWQNLFDAALAGGRGTVFFALNLALTAVSAAAATVYIYLSYRRDRRTAADKMKRLEE